MATVTSYNRAQIDALLAQKAAPAQITAAIAALVGAAPAALDTLVEIDAQLQADEGSAAALSALVATKAASLTTIAVSSTASGTLAADTVHPIDASAGTVARTLPTPTKVGQVIEVEKVDSTPNSVAISGTIRGATSTLSLLWQYESILLVAESLTSWRPFAGHKTKTALDAAYLNVLGTSSNPVASATAVRPTGLTVVYWRSSTQPTNWQPGDIWIGA